MKVISSLFLLTLSLLGVDPASAEEYVEQLTQLQCAARGGRIIRWTNTAGVGQDVGVCRIDDAPSERRGSSGGGSRSNDSADRPYTREETLAFARTSEAWARDGYRDRNWSKVTYSAGVSAKSYSQIGDHAAAARMKELQSSGECKKLQQQASEARAKDNLRFAKFLLTKALPDCEASSTDVAIVNSELAALGGSSAPEPRAQPAPSAPMTPPQPQPQPQTPGSATNCISITEGKFRQFTLRNECTFTVYFRLDATNIDRTRESTYSSLTARATGSVISYHEDPAIADPKTPVEQARDEYAVLQRMRSAINDMPEGPAKKAQEERFTRLLAEFVERTQKLK